MIEEHILQTCIFPWILFERDGKVVSANDGILFPRPFNVSEAAYATLKPPIKLGWSASPDGYALYVAAPPHMPGHKLMLYGLKVEGLSTARGKSEKLSIRCSRSDVENYVSLLLQSAVVMDQTFINITRSNIHDVRSINKEIYSNADNLDAYFSSNKDLDRIQHNNVKRIVKLSSTLRTKSDFMDIIANAELAKGKLTKIPVYKNFDMVMRTLFAGATEKNIRMFMSGSSKSDISGYGHFNQIPFLLLDNAVKYSPNGEEIEVRVDEDDSQIFVRISSVGPVVEKYEQTRIFSFSYRGVNAVKLTEGGTGVGLYVLKNLVELHGGSVTFFQEERHKIIDGILFCPTHFHLRFPRLI